MLKIIVVCLVLFSLTGCSFDFRQPEIKINPIVIGGLLDMTGSAQEYGQVLKKVTTLRVEQWNEAGGIGGRPVEVRWENGNCNERVAEYAAYQLINEDKVSIIWGGVCSDETIGAAKVTEDNKVILMSPTASSSLLSDMGEYIFRTIASSASQGEVLARHVFDKKYRKVGVLIEKTGYTKDLLDAFKKQYKGEVLALEVFPHSENTALDQIKELQRQKVDAILVFAQSADTVHKSISRMKDLGWEGGIILDEVGVQHPEVITEFSDYLLVNKAVGALYIVNTETNKMREFRAEYQARFGERLDYLNFTASMLDAVDVTLEVLGYVDDVYDTKAIADILYSTQHIGYTGNISFDENGDLRAGYSLMEFDGKVFFKSKK